MEGSHNSSSSERSRDQEYRVEGEDTFFSTLGNGAEKQLDAVQPYVKKKINREAPKGTGLYTRWSNFSARHSTLAPVIKYTVIALFVIGLMTAFLLAMHFTGGYNQFASWMDGKLIPMIQNFLSKNITVLNIAKYVIGPAAGAGFLTAIATYLVGRWLFCHKPEAPRQLSKMLPTKPIEQQKV